MSDSQAYEEVTVASEGVTVTKRFEEDEFPVPAIAFEFESSRDEGVTVRLTDTVPDDIEVEDLGFHPEYGSEYWTIDDDHITFERDLDANSSYTTVYGIRATGSDDIQQFLAEPTLESVDPPLPEGESHEDIVPGTSDDVVKDAIAGDGEIPGLEDEEDDEDDEEDDVGTLDLKDPNEPEGGTAEASTDGAEGDADTEAEADADTDGAAAEGGEVTVPDDSLIGAMAEEIRQKNVSAEDVKLLRRAFEIAAEEGGSTAAKIDQIQSDIADLRAYTTSLEEFLDDNGTAEQLIEEFKEQVEQFEQQLDDVEAALDEQSEQIESVDESVDSMSEEVDTVSKEVATVNEDIDTLDEEVSSVRREVNGLGNEVEDFEDTMEEIEDDIEELQEKVTEGDVAERIDDIEDSIEDLQTWQEQIKETFGG
jgi:predicted  nucleic acid-binding Zn-ribbon protein